MRSLVVLASTALFASTSGAACTYANTDTPLAQERAALGCGTDDPRREAVTRTLHALIAAHRLEDDLDLPTRLSATMQLVRDLHAQHADEVDALARELVDSLPDSPDDEEPSLRIMHEDALTVSIHAWPARSMSSLHNHERPDITEGPQSVAVYFILQGTVAEQRFEPTGDGAYVERNQTARTRDIFGLLPNAIHRVSNPGDDYAISLHAYSTAMRGGEVFTLDDAGNPRFVRGWREDDAPGSPPDEVAIP